MKTAGFQLIILIIGLAVSFPSMGQQNYFVLPIDFKVVNGDMDLSQVKVVKNGKAIFTRSCKSNMRLKLDYNQDYLLSFSKPGFITKTIEVNTHIPEQAAAHIYEPYKIGVRLFKQYEGVNIVMFSQPVALIKYDSALDEFNYDVDYTRAILSKITEAEKALEIKAGLENKQSNSSAKNNDNREKANERYNQNSGSAANSSIEDPDYDFRLEKNNITREPAVGQNKRKVKGDEGKETGSSKVVSGGQDELNTKILQGGNDERPLADSNTGFDKNEGKLNFSEGKDENIKIESNEGMDAFIERPVNLSQPIFFKRHWDEPNRTITVIRKIEKMITTEYRKVNYSWGGIYYFKDGNFAISKDVFNWSTGEK